MRPSATVSVDVDPVDLHLLGYGHSDLVPDDAVYTTALPRLAEAFECAGVCATFFVVARDAARQADVLKSLVARGHEIASHSFTHPLGLRRLDRAMLAHEVEDSRAALEQAAGAAVTGFRAPNFDLDQRVLAAIVRAGYRYDASGYPTPFLIPARLMLALKSDDPLGVLRLGLWPASWQRLPHRLAEGGLFEFPASVTPVLRVPIYHTLRYLTEGARFLGRIEGLARRGEPLSYLLHAVDALGLVEDGVDERLAAHPGMRRTLAEKRTMLDEVLATVARHFEPRTFGDRLREGAAG